MAVYTTALANIFDVICIRAYTGPSMSRYLEQTLICCCYLFTLIKTKISQKELLKINCPQYRNQMFLFFKKKKIISLLANFV
jgi:hypothetical protein